SGLRRHPDERRGGQEAAVHTADAMDIRSGQIAKSMQNDGQFGDFIKILWHDGLGISLYAKRLERGRFIWPSPADGVVSISAGQLGYLLEGIDWRHPQRTWRPAAAG
ncbi:MAG: IS66 family insertion sequence element accessory protein TnpB, partial [Geminicoccaceae bacterium]